MAVYTSIYTGTQIDEGVGKGLSAVQPDTEASLTTLTLGQSPDALTEGQIAWNPDDGTLDIGLNGGEVILQAGQEVMYRVQNDTGATIPNGALVMSVGTNGMSGVILVDLADATGNVEARYILGVATEEIPDGERGYVTHFGKVRGVDTSMWSDGDVLWADPAVLGGLTNVEPEAPSLKLPIAFVINSHAVVGTLAVRVDTGSRLGDLHDVQTDDLPTNAMLVWDDILGRWASRTATLNDLENVDYETPNNVDTFFNVGFNQSTLGFLYAKTFSDGVDFNTLTFEHAYELFAVSGAQNTSLTQTQYTFEVTGSSGLAYSYGTSTSATNLEARATGFVASGFESGFSWAHQLEASRAGLGYYGLDAGEFHVLEVTSAGFSVYGGPNGSPSFLFTVLASGAEVSVPLASQSGVSMFGVGYVDVQPGAVEDVVATATVGTLPTPDGSVTIADASAPTVQELLEYIRELEAKVQQMVGVLETFGLTQPR